MRKQYVFNKGVGGVNISRVNRSAISWIDNWKLLITMIKNVMLYSVKKNKKIIYHCNLLYWNWLLGEQNYLRRM